MPSDNTRRMHVIADHEVVVKAERMASAVGLRRGRLCSRSALIEYLIRRAKPSEIAEEMAKEEKK